MSRTCANSAEPNRLKVDTVNQDNLGVTPLRVSVPHAMKALGLSRTTFYQRIADGKLKAHKDGNRTFISNAEMARYVAACEGGPGVCAAD